MPTGGTARGNYDEASEQHESHAKYRCALHSVRWGCFSHSHKLLEVGNRGTSTTL